MVSDSDNCFEGKAGKEVEKGQKCVTLEVCLEKILLRDSI